eukprot:gnl/MRDRNA2_/MRDRNA2_103484_c0_seq1.p1 gnl/MRDRNA2_/MRDRNA2_103484_c0~~gnl/MRDRNA2_/MRDRNA2_103484_c0_seq1.p1  ORF type:complete len:988 (+),score=124.27 gnl/MRDRNA2_/MRDRNA2_103484_c0_seq1:52-2964(+)
MEGKLPSLRPATAPDGSKLAGDGQSLGGTGRLRPVTVPEGTPRAGNKGHATTAGDGYSIAKGFIRPVTAPDSIGKGIPSKKWMKYDLSKHCWPQEDAQSGTLKIPQAQPHWMRPTRGDRDKHQQTVCAVRLTHCRGLSDGPLWSVKDVARLVSEVNLKENGIVQTLPAGALVVVAAYMPGDRVQLVTDSDSETLIPRNMLAPLGSDAKKTIRAYIKSLPRGRKAHFGVWMPFCASELHFKHAVYVAHAAGIQLEHGWLTYEIMCANAAAQLYPSRCESWLSQVVSHALSAGLDVEHLFPNIAQSGNIGSMLPQPVGTLDKLPAGGLCNCMLAFQHTVQMLLLDTNTGGANHCHIQSLQEQLACCEEVVHPHTEFAPKPRLFPCHNETHMLHHNLSGTHVGFSSFTAYKKYTRDITTRFGDEAGFISIVKPSVMSPPSEDINDETKIKNLEILVKHSHLKKLHPGDLCLFNTSLPHVSIVRKELTAVLDRWDREYAEIWKAESSHDLKVVESIAFTKSSTWPQHQSTGDVVVLYRKAWGMLPTLYVFCHQLMSIFSVEPRVRIKVQPVRGRIQELCVKDPVAFANRDFTDCTSILICRCEFTALPMIAAVAEYVDQNLGPSSTLARRRDCLARLGMPPEVLDLDVRCVAGRNGFSDKENHHRCIVLLVALGSFIATVRLEYTKCEALRSKCGGRNQHAWFNYIKDMKNMYVGEALTEEDDLNTEHRIWIRNGFGAEKTLDGDLYVGLWVNGKRHGFGTLWDTSGNIYQGEFVRGIRDGKGIIWHIDGKVFQGEFTGQHLHGKSFTWNENGAAEVMDHANQVRAIFNKDRTRATLELLLHDATTTKDKDHKDGHPDGQEQSPVVRENSKKKRCSAAEEACEMLGIERGAGRKEVTTWEACKILDITNSPEEYAPILQKVEVPRYFSSQVIMQTAKTAKVDEHAQDFTTQELNAIESLTAFEDCFGIRSARCI